MTTTDPRLAQIKERLSKATPGPWKIEREDTHRDDGDDAIGFPIEIGPISFWEHKREPWMEGGDDAIEADAAFMANAPADIAWLIEQLEDPHA